MRACDYSVESCLSPLGIDPTEGRRALALLTDHIWQG